MVDFDIENMSSGGSVYVGNIEPAQSSSCSANLLVDTKALGESKGKIIITYEDSYGKEYTKKINVSTVIEEKVEIVLNESENKENEKKQQSLVGVYYHRHNLWSRCRICCYENYER